MAPKTRKRKFATSTTNHYVYGPINDPDDSDNDYSESPTKRKRSRTGNIMKQKRQKKVMGDEEVEERNESGGSTSSIAMGNVTYIDANITNTSSVGSTNVEMQPAAYLSRLATELLTQIFERVFPLDLLHLAQTCKDLRGILMSNTSRSIWQYSRAILPVPGMPDCPEDLSEPQYASLMFTEHCQFCQAANFQFHSVDIFTSFSARIRSCKSCLHDGNMFANNHRKSPLWWDGPYSEKLSGYLHQVEAPYTQYVSTITTFWYLPAHELWTREYKNAKRKAQWENKKMTERNIVRAHAAQCEEWVSEWEAYLVRERKKLVVKHIKSMGWADEFDRIRKPEDEPQHTVGRWWDALLRCDVTDSVLTENEPHFESAMRHIRDKRFNREHVCRVRQAIPVLQDVLKTLALDFPPNTILPAIGDVIMNPIIQEIIHGSSRPDPSLITNNSFVTTYSPAYQLYEGLPWTEFTVRDTGRPDILTTAHFAPFCAIYHEAILQYRQETEAKLVAIIAAELGNDYQFDPATVLELATTVFRCHKCYRYDNSLQYPRVLVHRHAYMARLSSNPKGEELIDKEVLQCCNKAIWGNDCNTIFLLKDMHFLSEVLTSLGYDPKVVTRAEVEVNNPIFACMSCSSPGRRLAFRWSSLIQHKDYFHANGYPMQSPMVINQLNEQDAQIARIKLAEMDAKVYACEDVRMYEPCMMCVHCREVGPTGPLSIHIKETHNISNPTSDDMVPILDAYCGHECSLPIAEADVQVASA